MDTRTLVMRKIHLNALIAICLSAPYSQSLAVTYPVSDQTEFTSKSAQTQQYTSNKDTLEFKSEDEFEAHQLTRTGIMFYYTKDAAEALGSVENIEKFITNSIDIGNEAYINSGIPARIQIIGLKEAYFAYDDKSKLYEGRLAKFKDANPEANTPNLHASHYVLINKFYEDTHTTLGAAHTPGNISYVSSQKNNTTGSIALVHELAHNKGVQHKSSSSASLRNKAYGSTCDYFASIMGTGRILYKFFSTPDIYINGYQCGDETHDAAGALREELDKGGDYLNSKETKKIIPLQEPSGIFSFNEFQLTSDEDSESINVQVSFENTTKGASIQLFSDNSDLIQNFDNPILVSKGVNDTQIITLPLKKEWRYSEDRTITFFLKYPAQVNKAYDEITFNIDSLETDTELSMAPTEADKKESGSLNAFISILMCSLVFIRTKKKAFLKTCNSTKR